MFKNVFVFSPVFHKCETPKPDTKSEERISKGFKTNSSNTIK
jgi:hypothetical protein